MKFSFIGLGNMGAPLALNILKAGEDLTIYSSKPETKERFASLGAKVVDKKSSLADCDVLCSCVPLPQDVINLALGEDGLYSKMKPGSIHLEFSTIDPKTANILAKAAAEKGIGYVQATVSKTPAIAAEGNAPLFVGGDRPSLEKLTPILEKIGKPANVKTIDAACAVKLLSNLIGMTNIAIVAEGLKIAKTAEMDLTQVLELLLDTGAAGFQMKTRGPKMIDEDFSTLFSVNLARKDLILGCKMAEQFGLDAALMKQTLAYLEKARDMGLGEEDVSAIYEVIE